MKRVYTTLSFLKWYIYFKSSPRFLIEVGLLPAKWSTDNMTYFSAKEDWCNGCCVNIYVNTGSAAWAWTGTKGGALISWFYGFGHCCAWHGSAYFLFCFYLVSYCTSKEWWCIREASNLKTSRFNIRSCFHCLIHFCHISKYMCQETFSINLCLLDFSYHCFTSLYYDLSSDSVC